MNKRMTDTNIWEQRWFKRMSPGNKLAYQYIKDRCNHAGVWSMDIIQLAEDLATDSFNLEKFLNQVNRDFDPITGEAITRERVKVVDGKYLWIVGYITFHWGGKNGKLSANNQTVKGALAILERVGIIEEALEKEFIVLDAIKDVNSTIEAPMKPLVSPSEAPERGTYKDKGKDKGRSKDSIKEKGQNSETETAPATETRRSGRYLNEIPLPEALDTDEFLHAYENYCIHLLQKFQTDVSPKSTEQHITQLIRWKAQGHDPTEIINGVISDGNKKLYLPTEIKTHDSKNTEKDQRSTRKRETGIVAKLRAVGA
jgi:hypothetical protein